MEKKDVYVFVFSFLVNFHCPVFNLPLQSFQMMSRILMYEKLNLGFGCSSIPEIFKCPIAAIL